MAGSYIDAARKGGGAVSSVWLDAVSHLSASSRRVAWGGLLLVPVFWLLDGAIDFALFSDAESYFDELLRPEPVELYMRLLVSFLFVAFGLYSAFLLAHAEKVERDLRVSNGQLEALKAELERLVVVDPLTGMFNRRKFHEALDVSIATANRHRHRFALLMIDIDHFKAVNDRFGHQAGDRVLRNVSELIKPSIRSEDQMFRVGGEEFCLMAPATDAEQAILLAEKVRRVVEIHTFPGVGNITLSIGIAGFIDGDTQESLYARADAALYEAKHRGRNCVMSVG